jgi:hypothetical protein
LFLQQLQPAPVWTPSTKVPPAAVPSQRIH